MNENYKINTNEQLDESFLNFENNILDESNMILNSRYFERESKPKSEFDTKTDILTFNYNFYFIIIYIFLIKEY